jgi:hypothetical protein
VKRRSPQLTRFMGPSPFLQRCRFPVVAIRGFTNERSEFLMSTILVLDLDQLGSIGPIIPQMADGGGWKTEVELTNLTHSAS